MNSQYKIIFLLSIIPQEILNDVEGFITHIFSKHPGKCDCAIFIILLKIWWGKLNKLISFDSIMICQFSTFPW